MKIVYKENEKERLEEFYQNEEHHKIFTDLSKIYSINFKVTNPALAQYFLVAMTNNRLEDFDIGISIESINFFEAKTNERLKEDLYRAIDEVLK